MVNNPISNEDSDKDSEENKFSEFYPGIEYYEAESKNLELLIEKEKRRISKDLQNELIRIQFLLDKRERAIAIKELELAQREADLNAREARLSRLEALELTPSPKQYDQ